MAKKITKLEDLTPDPQNANRGTERGRALLDTSLRSYGAGRSILADKDGTVIAGNKTLEAAAELGLTIREVHTTGDELVVVVRDDLSLATDPAARELAYADNRVSQVDLDFDPVVLAADLEAGVDLSKFWFEPELQKVLEQAGTEIIDAAELWQGMPEYENEAQAARSLHIHFPAEADCARFCAVLGLSITEKTKTVWYPAAPDHAKYRFASDES